MSLFDSPEASIEAMLPGPFHACSSKLISGNMKAVGTRQGGFYTYHVVRIMRSEHSITLHDITQEKY